MPSHNASVAVDSRQAQTFPVLSSDEIGQLSRFGRPSRYAPGDALFVAGRVGPGMVILLSGRVSVMERDALHHTRLIATQGPGWLCR